MKVESVKNFFLHPQKIPSKPIRILSYSTIALLVIFSACTYLIPLVLTNRKVVQQKPDQTGSAGIVGRSFFNGTPRPPSQNNSDSSQPVKFSDGYVGPVEDIYKLDEEEEIESDEVEENIIAVEEKKLKNLPLEVLHDLLIENSPMNPTNEEERKKFQKFLKNLDKIFVRLSSTDLVVKTDDHRNVLLYDAIRNDPGLIKYIPYNNKVVGSRMALNYFILAYRIHGYQNIKGGINLYFSPNDIPADRLHEEEYPIITKKDLRI